MITISPGENTTTVSIPIINDDQLEAVEFFDVAFAIQRTNGATMGKPRIARVAIRSEDGKLCSIDSHFNEAFDFVNL